MQTSSGPPDAFCWWRVLHWVEWRWVHSQDCGDERWATSEKRGKRAPEGPQSQFWKWTSAPREETTPPLIPLGFSSSSGDGSDEIYIGLTTPKKVIVYDLVFVHYLFMHRLLPSMMLLLMKSQWRNQHQVVHGICMRYVTVHPMYSVAHIVHIH